MTASIAAEPAGRSRAHAQSRFHRSAHPLAFWVLPWVLVAAATYAALVPTLYGDDPVAGYRTLFRVSGCVYAGCGLIAWRRRPDTYTGPLMVATGCGLFVEPLLGQFDPGLLRTLGDLFEDAWSIPIIALMLTFLNGGRLRTRGDRLLVGIFGLQLAVEFVRHLFLAREGNFLLVHRDADVAQALNVFAGILVSFGCLAVAVTIGLRWRAAPPPRRRAMLPSVAGIGILLFFAVAQQAAPIPLRWLAVLSLALIPAAFLFGLLRSRLARAGLADLFRVLPSMRGAELEAALARTLGDPNLTVEYAHGPEGRTIAALHYDPSLDEDPELVEAVTAAATMALENEHLHEQSAARLAELQASRERIVSAGGWSATSTTAPSSGSSPSRCSCACSRCRSTPIPSRRRSWWAQRARSSRSRWRSCASSRAASTPRCSTTGSRPRSRPWRATAPSPRPCAARARTTCPRRSSSRPTS